MAKQKFGGSWTEQKLEMIFKYLGAYSKIMKNKNFRFAYVDAFAGTGYREVKSNSKTNDIEDSLITDVVLEFEPQAFLDGSAKNALRVKPEFDRYIYIEKSPERFNELTNLKNDFPEKKDQIVLINQDANKYLKDFCSKTWTKNRAVVFLDPFGMQVSWETLNCIAKTKAIDLWILFPLGSGVSRLLRRDGKISETLRKKLDSLFGEESWYDAFYQPKRQQSLFDDDSLIEKVANFESIAAYFVKRLKTIFPHVLDDPLFLYNSKNNPLFMLCFAAGNDKGGKTAVKIAADILRS